MLAKTVKLLKNNGDCRVCEVLSGPFPARVRGCDSSGKGFDIETVLKNLSASNFFIEIDRCIKAPEKLFIVTKVYRVTIALRGVVLRIDPVTEDTSRLEIRITSHRFLPADESAELALA